MIPLLYTTFPSPFNTFTVVWGEIDSYFKIQRIFLSDPENKSEIKALESFKEMQPGSNSLISSLGAKIQRFLRGDQVDFDLKLVDFNKCYEIQKKVLHAEYRIPRGYVSTYNRIANHLGIKNGARVVGNALAKNLFPIIIPCHRAVKTNGDLGGFQGGIYMKRALLKQEGIKFNDKGKVIMNTVFY